MRKRMIIMLVSMAAVIGLLGTIKFRQIQTAIAQGASWAPPPEAVTTVVARKDEWQAVQSAIGTVTAVQGVTVSADQPGIVKRILFESGSAVRKGQVLVELDTNQERAQLAAAEAQRNLTDLNLERIRGLHEKGVAAPAEFDRMGAENKQAEARVAEMRAVIERKTIRAPFSGVLGIRQVNLGQYLAGGDPVVPLQSLDPIYVTFAVPQQEVGRLQVGAVVKATADGAMSDGATADGAAADSLAGSGSSIEATGKITAVDAIVDEATRNVQIQATFRNPDRKLRPGMFVGVQVLVGGGDPVVALPATAINYAAYGNSIFIVEDLKGPEGQTYRGVRQQFVKLGPARGDQVAVLSGLKPGEEVVTSGVFKLRNGAAVMVNNEVQPTNDPTPRPEDS